MSAFSRGFRNVSLGLHLPLRQSATRNAHRHTIQFPRPRPDQYFGRYSRVITRKLTCTVRNGYSAKSPITGDPIVLNVMRTRQPALLYKEPPMRPYLLRVYAFATLATGVGAFNFWWASHLPKEQPIWVPPIYLFIGAAFVVIGVHIFQRPVRRISLLEVLPASMGGRLQLRITARKSPFAKESVLVTEIWEPMLSERTFPMVEEMQEAQRARTQALSEGLENYNIISKSWELAARFIDQKWTSFFLKFKYFVLQFGIAHINLDGVKWKVDCTGYLREEGKGWSLLDICPIAD